MSRLSHIEFSISFTKIDAVRLSKYEAKEVLENLKESFSVDFTTFPPPWDGAKNAKSVQRSDGWKLPALYVDSIDFILIDGGAARGSTPGMWKLKSGEDLINILEHCPSEDYYICDTNQSFLICSNSHDFLIGWGPASVWVESYKRLN